MSSVLPTRPPAEVTVTPMAGGADAAAFKQLNEEWIARLFTLEPADRRILDNPQAEIVDQGGQVLIARSDGAIVGCVALVAACGGVFELSKMTVAPASRGLGIGRVIILAAIDYARTLGATSLFLGSSTKLANAVRLYEAMGFTHVPLDQLGPLPYRRADVFMRYVLAD